MKKILKNWKTTLFGIIAGAGMLMSNSNNPTIKAIGTLIVATGVGAMGANAKDNNVTGGSIPNK